ncbi:TPA: hypothetical protein KAV15_001199 [Escherichia coli]|uniref:hypothetical protein n=1 Tax=Hafniaceae TaxID=1903412 RepID=UPI0015EADE0A|nr:MULTISPECIES: hypothetical protein [Enterobacterales]MCE9947867.1 hypothetical protein [Hafnia paralvei]QMA45185.1 hypothetical protein HV030_00405 [Citrobacter freundii]HBB4139992.1 hypothetical protein [Escherichia coli]
MENIFSNFASGIHLTIQNHWRTSLETDEILFTHAGVEGVLLSECVRLKQSRIAKKLISLSARFKAREIRHKLIWLCWYDLMQGASMTDWLENLKRMNHVEICFWLGQRQEKNVVLTKLMDEYVVSTRY